MSKKVYRKALNFDLDTKSLKKYYPGKNYRNAYKDIKQFFLKNGFEHRQWSGYVSKDKISNTDVWIISARIRITFPWLSHCVKKFDVTDVGRQYDLTHLFTSNKLNRNMNRKNQNTQKQSFYALTTANQLKNDAQKKESRDKENPDKDKSNDKSIKKPRNKDDLDL